MKFFTPGLYDRCRSSDETILNAACEDWERANEAYERHLQTIEADFPPHIREFAGLLLHDAKVQSIGRQGKELIMVLHKDIPPRELVVLRYDLESDPVVAPFAGNSVPWERPTDFQFDELDVVHESGRALYLETIVFGNGWRMDLRFRDVQVTVAQPIYPSSTESVIPALPTTPTP
jgi:hypothetical protein